jgi:hypothetical protein
MQNSLSRSSLERDLALMQQEDVRAEDKGRVEDNLRQRECMSKWFDPNTRSLPASAFRCVSADFMQTTDRLSLPSSHTSYVVLTPRQASQYPHPD